MTFDELEAWVKETLPNAALAKDNEGQIIIYTNLKSRDDNYFDWLFNFNLVEKNNE